MKLNNRIELTKLFDKYKNLLTQTQKQALTLYLIEDISITEISKILATTRQAVYDALKKAKNKLLEFDKKVIL